MADVTGPVGAGGVAVVGDVGGLGSSIDPTTIDGARNCADGGRRRSCGSPADPEEFERGSSKLGLLAIPGCGALSNGGARPGSGSELRREADGLLRRPPWKEGSKGSRPGGTIGALGGMSWPLTGFGGKRGGALCVIDGSIPGIGCCAWARPKGPRLPKGPALAAR